MAKTEFFFNNCNDWLDEAEGEVVGGGWSPYLPLMVSAPLPVQVLPVTTETTVTDCQHKNYSWFR